MAKRLDHILVIDIEATCWEGNPPAGQTSEVIEIGVCPLEISTLTRLGKRSMMVRPERSVVSPFCTGLTTITPEMAAGGVTFREACKTLRREFLADQRAWASFGDYDRKQFERQCRETGMPYPFGPTHLNVKTLFALSRGLPREIGAREAVEAFGHTFEGTHHRGDDDAWNVAAVLIEVLRKMRV
ncbi:MAG TPA: 3'-5' exonuclease [Fimbriiglobus sp.]|nr:3'-5' exonuclease [Fimbriiglobus sp.]